MKRFLNAIILIITDLLIYYFVLFFSFKLRTLLSGNFFFIYFKPPVGINFRSFLDIYWIPAIFIVFYLFEGVYINKRPLWLDLKHMIKAVTLSTFSIYALISLARLPLDVSRFVLLFTGFSWLVFTVFSHTLIRKFVYNKLPFLNYNVVLVGDERFYRAAKKSIDQNSYLGYKVKCWIAVDKQVVGENAVEIMRYFKDIDWVSLSKKYRYLIVSEIFANENRELIQKLLLLFEELFIVPVDSLESLINVDVLFLFSSKLFLTRVRNNLASFWNRLLKEVFDRVVGLILLLFSLPIIILASLIIVIEDGWPFWYLSKRVGYKGKPLYLLKLRTMVKDAAQKEQELIAKDRRAFEEWNKYGKLKENPFVTRIGKILRATSLDELPQLINVVLGHINLVGPRPVKEDEIEKWYKEKRVFYYSYYNVKPGAVALWIVLGRNLLPFDTHVKLDFWYVTNWSLWLDIVILLKAIGVIVSRRGAY